MASAEEEQVDLVPEWLAKGHSLHSPGPHISVGGMRDSRHGRGSSSSNRGLLTPDSPFLQQPHQKSSTPYGVSSLTTSLSEERPAGWSPKSRQQRATGFGVNQQRSSHHGNRVFSNEERNHILGAPFSPTGKGGSSSSSSQFWPHQGSAPSVVPPSSSSTCNTVDRGKSSATSHAQVQHFGLQRTLSEGSSRHADALGVDNIHHKDNAHYSSRGRAANSAAARKLELKPSEFPSLGASSSNGNSPHPSSSSSRKQASPEPYTPSLAPYKQGFLASRASAGWTSKLADVPAAVKSDGIQPDAEAHSHAQPTAASAASTNSNNRSSAAGNQRGDAVAAHAVLRSGSADNTTGACPVGCGSKSSSSSTAGAAAAQLQPSLADTLKQAAAASAGNASSAGHLSDAQRRHSVTLVPLLPGCKAKHVGTTTRTVPAPGGMRLPSGSGSKAAGADLQSPTGHTPLLMLSHSSHSNHSSQGSRNTVVGSLHHSPADPDATSAADSGVQGSTVTSPLQSPVAVSAADSTGATMQGLRSASAAVSPSGRLGSGLGSAGIAEQRQQLQDRNSFFAVLRRKTTSTSSTGEQSGGDGGMASRGGSSSSSSSNVGQGAETHPICTCVEAAADADEKLATSSNTAARTAAATAQPAGVVAVVDGASSTSDAEAEPGSRPHHHQQQQHQQRCDAASSQVQADVSASKQVSVVTAVEQQQYNQPLPETSVRSHPISASSSQDEEHFEVLTAQQAASRDSSDKLSSGSPQEQRSSNGASILWDLPAEEEAFLRSLGWTAEPSDDESEWVLTEEEIASFQAAAAARAAASQQARRQQQQQQQNLLLANATSGASLMQLQQKAQLLQSYERKTGANPGNTWFRYSGAVVRGQGVWGVGVNSSRCVQGNEWGRQPGLLLGADVAPAAVLLGYDGYNDSGSSDDEEDP